MKRLVTTVLLVLALGASALASADETVLFRLDGQAHRASDLPDALALKLNQLDVEHYYKLQQLVDDAVVDAWVSQQAAASGRDREQVRNELLAVTPATEAEIEARYGDRLRVVFVDFPINPSGISRIVARGAACAAEQGRFWDYHDLAFERQRQLDASAPGTLAAALKLDMTAFQSCLAAPRAQAVVARGAAEAARLGLDSTPTLFLNGRRLILPSIERDLPVAIEAALAEAG